MTTKSEQNNLKLRYSSLLSKTRSQQFKDSLIMSARQSLGIEGRFYTNGLELKHKLQKKRLRECEIPNKVADVSAELQKWSEEFYVEEARAIPPFPWVRPIFKLIPLSRTVGVLRGSVSMSSAFVNLSPNRTTRTRNPAQLAISPHRSLIREGQNYWSLRSLLTLFRMLTHRPRKLLSLPYACQKLVEAHSGR